jgi:transcriptional regulator of acetoin/glycerol metabolism/DNA-binding CsgD family transcriptional regulator
MSVAGPFVERLAADLAAADISVVLTDDQGRVTARHVPHEEAAQQLDQMTLRSGYDWSFERVGSNGVSDALTTGSPSLVVGGEHFCDALTSITTAGAPIRHPHTREVVAVLGLVMSAAVTNSLLLPISKRAARELEENLCGGQIPRERLLEDAFLTARRRTRRPLALVSADRLLANAAAARMVGPTDQTRLWEFALRHLRSDDETDQRFTTASGTELLASVEAVSDGREIVGVLVRFTAGPARLRPGRFGWDTLTQAELSVTDLVAEGLTNRQIARRLYVSPYTVDAHLRHIFQKLEINSRVDLVRIATSRAVSDSALAA